MIQNQRQYKITLSWIEKFEKSAQEIATSEKAEQMHPVDRKLYADSFQGQLDTLREEVAVYEALSQGKPADLPVESFPSLPLALINARIAAGLTQKQLAMRLGLKEQQIQRYEATGYQAADFARLGEIMDALGVTFEGKLHRTSKS